MMKLQQCVVVVALAVSATQALAEDTTRKASVVCTTDASAYPFAAGNDRCFKDISRNGEWVRLPLKSAAACAVNTSDGLRLYFTYSTQDKASCVFMSNPVGKAEYEWGLEALGADEKAFFLEHVQPD
jgi:hypothetical protein